MAGIAIIKDSFRGYIWEKTGTVAIKDKLTHVVSVGEITQDVEEIDTTTIDSDAKESTGGFDDYGSVDIELNIVNDEFTKMKALADSKQHMQWAFVADDATGTEVFQLHGEGWVKTCKFSGASVGGLLKVTATVKISGAPKSTGFTEPNVTPEG